MSNKSLLIEWRQRWNRSLFQFLRRRARTAVDVQDLAQETYLRLLRANNLSEVRNPHAYLLQVAKHVAMEWCDHQPRPDAMVTLDEETLADERLPELELDAHLSQQRLEQTLDGLPPAVRAVIVLRLRDQRSSQEIAAELQITPRQVRRYLARGYECVRKALED
jgi:RNA polymerase sigma-70 factor (ECF subfamily)